MPYELTAHSIRHQKGASHLSGQVKLNNFNIGKYAGKYVINWKLEQLSLEASEAQLTEMIPLIEKKAYELERDLTMTRSLSG